VPGKVTINRMVSVRSSGFRGTGEGIESGTVSIISDEGHLVLSQVYSIKKWLCLDHAPLGQSGCQGSRCLTSVRSGDDRDGADSYLNSVGVIGDASWTSHGSTLFVWLKKPRVPIGGIERRPRRGGATYSRTNRVPGASLGDVMHRAGRAPDLPATSKMVDVPPGVTLNCISRAAEAIRRKVRRRSMRLPG
jgi:hypothetical protein